MKVINIMFDSLNRRFLEPYGCTDTLTPNFVRLAKKTTVFNNCYIGSAPCIPARRELHTGKYNMLHRSWGPLEPFDFSMPSELAHNGIHSHLITDHYHYWEDGGATYHNRFSSYEIIRGQEGDICNPEVADPIIPEHIGQGLRQDWISKSKIKQTSDLPIDQTFEQGIKFIKKNSLEDNWFLQLEAFDPHEPFRTSDEFMDLYPEDYNGKLFDWPIYGPVKETVKEVEHLRNNYRRNISMCDAYLGKILDLMDENNLWEDTMLIVNTDHGFLLGEHNYWAKCVQPFYNEIAHIPLFIYNPNIKNPKKMCDSLVQTIDIVPTILDFFGISIPDSVSGKSLNSVIANDLPVRDYALFGIHGGHLNITDGKLIYMRAPDLNQPAYEYTLMPTIMKGFYPNEHLKKATLSEGMAFSAGLPVLRFPALSGAPGGEFTPAPETLYFNLENDPTQEHPIDPSEVPNEIIGGLKNILDQNEAPQEVYKRYGL